MNSFRERVYKVVRKIPKGKIMTYKEVAERAGVARGWRVVGNVLNKNPDLKRIPCHRVIRSDGRVGGYKYGNNKKTSLLRKEGITIKQGRVIF